MSLLKSDVLRSNQSVMVIGNLPENNNSKIDDSDITSLCNLLNDNHEIELIDISFNEIGDDGVSILAEFLKTSSVKFLNLEGNNIGSLGAIALADMLKINDKLEVLNLKANKFGKKGGLALAKSLRDNSTLRELDIGETDQEMESLIGFAIVLTSINFLEKLNVSRPLLFTHQEESTIHFSNMLKVNTSLTELHLAKMDIKDLGAMWLANSLISNKTLRLLDLSCNGITCDGAYDIARLLRENETIQILDLSCNDLKDEGALEIATALVVQTSLKKLSVTNNSIKDSGLCGLADSIIFNTALTELYIWGNYIGVEAAETLSNLIMMGRLNAEDVDFNPYIVDDVTYLAWYRTKPREFKI